MRATDEYRQIVGDKVVSEILQLAWNLYGLRVLHINPTCYGGGVAEMLYSAHPTPERCRRCGRLADPARPISRLRCTSVSNFFMRIVHSPSGWNRVH